MQFWVEKTYVEARPDRQQGEFALPCSPKVVNIPIQNIYYLLCYAWDKLEEKEIVDVEPLDSTSLADLFARVLINGTNQWVGLGRSAIQFKLRHTHDFLAMLCAAARSAWLKIRFFAAAR